MSRIHILGASGSGTTTLGTAVAHRLGVHHVDADQLFWLGTDPPFTARCSAAERHALLVAALPADQGWVFSGSATNWGAPVEPLFDLIVFLRLDRRTRMARLRQREITRYGSRIAPGGDMAESSAAFLAWAEAYDTAGPEQRSLLVHEAWLLEQVAPVLRLDSARPIAGLVEEVLAALRTAG